MRFLKIKSAALVGFSVLIIAGCRNQTNLNSTNQTNSNAASSNSNSANQSKNEAKISAPQTVKFTSADSAEIVGTFYQSPKENSPAVLLLHQWQSNRQSFDEFARRLQAKNFGVLAIDGRGFGESVKTTDGKQISAQRTAEEVKKMKADVGAAFGYLSELKNVDASRIGIVGASYGSSLAIIYAAENSSVKAVALLSPGVNYFDHLPTEPAIKNYDKPVLLVASDDDKESADSVKKLKAANEKSEVQIYPKGGHGTDIFAAKVGLEDLLEQFLTKNL